MNQIETAVTAAFVMEGLTGFRFGQLQEAWQLHTQQGAVELVQEVVQYVTAINAMREAGEAVTGPRTETAGAFQDEVSVPFGQWMSCQIIAEGGALPDRNEVIGYIASLVSCSFAFVGQDSIDADDAIKAVANNLKNAAQ